MKRKQKSCQNEPSAGRFDGQPTASIKVLQSLEQDFLSNLSANIRDMAVVPPKEKKR
jgi:hypothetical protein